MRDDNKKTWLVHATLKKGFWRYSIVGRISFMTPEEVLTMTEQAEIGTSPEKSDNKREYESPQIEALGDWQVVTQQLGSSGLGPGGP